MMSLCVFVFNSLVKIVMNCTRPEINFEVVFFLCKFLAIKAFRFHLTIRVTFLLQILRPYLGCKRGMLYFCPFPLRFLFLFLLFYF